MSQRKIKIVDKKFQMRITFSLIGIVLIAFMLVIALLGIDAAIRNKEIRATLIDLDRSIIVEDNIVKAFVAYSRMNSGEEVRISVPKIQKDHEESIQIMKDLSTLLKGYERRNFFTLSAIIGVIILFAVFMYFYLINLTHRISGPLHVVKKHMQKIIDGGRPDIRELREKDEFKELYATFVSMVNLIDPVTKGRKSNDD
jgi:hypothetical protein